MELVQPEIRMWYPQNAAAPAAFGALPTALEKSRELIDFRTLSYP